MDTPDYSGEEEEAAPEQMAKLYALVEKLDAADVEVEQQEEKLKLAKEKARQLRENDIPDLMLSIGLKTLVTDTGLEVKLKEEVRASFFAKNPEKRLPAFEWLKANDHDGLIKNVVSARFGKDQEAVAEQFVEFCKKFERPVDLEQKRDIHPQTLLAFLREQRELGTAVPLEIFGACVQNIVKIKKPK